MEEELLIPEEAVKIEEDSQYLCVIKTVLHPDVLSHCQEKLNEVYGKDRVLIICSDSDVELYRLPNSSIAQR